MQSYTPIQQKILGILADGLPHLRAEFFEMLDDPFSNSQNLNSHISLLRKKLRPQGQDIVCEINCKRISYRHIRLLQNPYRG